MTPPVFAHGHLRLYLLSLLAESDHPMHGYELIQALGDRFGGTYVPSAGTIYPRLAKLEDEGMVTKVADGRKTVYAITDAGRAEVAARAGDLEGIEAGLADSVRLIADEVRGSVREAMKSLRADLAAAAQTDQGAAKARTSAEDAARADERADARAQARRAEAIVGEFRAAVRADLRTHLAHGGALAASVVDDLSRSLDEALRDLTRALRG